MLSDYHAAVHQPAGAMPHADLKPSTHESLSHAEVPLQWHSLAAAGNLLTLSWDMCLGMTHKAIGSGLTSDTSACRGPTGTILNELAQACWETSNCQIIFVSSLFSPCSDAASPDIQHHEVPSNQLQ